MFISSSSLKKAHIDYLCSDYNINIVGQKNYGIGYNEPRIYDRKELLERSYIDALERWKKHVSNEEKIFLIEDTSVKIDALSTEEKEVPGLDIKYWMKENSFSDIDKLLKEKNNRKCTVRSDIIMHIPKSLQKLHQNKTYLQFTGITDGFITEKEFEFSTNPIYPWLDNKTFNKWFIPENENLPLSMLPIDIADKYDFRKKAVIQMLDYLESHKKIKHKSDLVEELQKVINFTPTFILSGPTCSGKSTLAGYLSEKYNYFHIEASDFMWLKYYETHGIKSTVKIGDFATKMLNENAHIVTEQLLSYFNNITDQPIVVSGFRNPKEIEFMRRNSQFFYTNLIYIDANFEIRFDREIKRKRRDMEPSKFKFQEKDKLQNDLGLCIIKGMVEEVTYNESTKDAFFNLIDQKYNTSFEQINKNDFNHLLPVKKLNLERAILIAMYRHLDSYLSTTEISHIIDNEVLLETYKNRKNNVSRYFNFNFHPYYDIKNDEENERIVYKINYTGKSMALRILNKLSAVSLDKKPIEDIPKKHTYKQLNLF